MTEALKQVNTSKEDRQPEPQIPLRQEVLQDFDTLYQNLKKLPLVRKVYGEWDI